ncbi:MAG: hypothetical protein QME81_09860 [bacterium]|nr:hypothetical protein [bacterium]
MFKTFTQGSVFLIFLLGLSVNSFGFDFSRFGEPVDVMGITGKNVGWYNRGGSLAITPDGLTMIINVHKDRKKNGDGVPFPNWQGGSYDMYRLQRASINDDWYDRVDGSDLTPKNMNNISPNINTSGDDYCPSFALNGTMLVWENGGTTWVSFKNVDGTWGSKMRLRDYNQSLGGAAITTGGGEGDPEISEDGLRIIVNNTSSNRDLYVATRTSLTNPFGNFSKIPNVNSTSTDEDCVISDDGLLMFFLSTRSGTCKIWMSERESTSDPWSAPINFSDGYADLYRTYEPELGGKYWGVEYVGDSKTGTLYLGLSSGKMYVCKFGGTEVPVTIISIANQAGVRRTVTVQGNLNTGTGEVVITNWQEQKGVPEEFRK